MDKTPQQLRQSSFATTNSGTEVNVAGWLAREALHSANGPPRLAASVLAQLRGAGLAFRIGGGPARRHAVLETAVSNGFLRHAAGVGRWGVT